MTTKSKHAGSALRKLEAIRGGPLTLKALMSAIREGEEWSLAEMAKRLGVSRGHVAAIERGKAVSPASAARYAKALGYSEAQFVRLALQDSVKRAGLHYSVEVIAAA
jgi:transcriptional regulator with XRE-family HTH domain